LLGRAASRLISLLPLGVPPDVKNRHQLANFCCIDHISPSSLCGVVYFFFPPSWIDRVSLRCRSLFCFSRPPAECHLVYGKSLAFANMASRVLHALRSFRPFSSAVDTVPRPISQACRRWCRSGQRLPNEIHWSGFSPVLHWPPSPVFPKLGTQTFIYSSPQMVPLAFPFGAFPICVHLRPGNLWHLCPSPLQGDLHFPVPSEENLLAKFFPGNTRYARFLSWLVGLPPLC